MQEVTPQEGARRVTSERVFGTGLVQNSNGVEVLWRVVDSFGHMPAWQEEIRRDMLLMPV
ncbi:hypothetical protein TBK1r_17340 [Stieleria magnilauensis]|uniref:Uncharacterized protein n=1 Tax=Stieleria magnilauensis TaxID=2527963 RepID=A0ABX5XM86_9BACT|nr:hypothetical protein TBK1r_17340 [Planctomycetes bacterium TBK1r]